MNESTRGILNRLKAGLDVHEELVSALEKSLEEDPNNGLALFDICMDRWDHFRRRSAVLVALRVARAFPGQVSDRRVEGIERMLATPRRSRRRRPWHGQPSILIADGRNRQIVVVDLRRRPYNRIPRW